MIVEDDLDLRATLVRGLSEEGFVATGIETGKELLELAVREPPDLLVVDIGLPDSTDGTFTRCSAHRGFRLRCCS
jgi:DNA-binding response OmpR family regulator